MPERGLFRWAGAKRHLIDKVAPLINAHRAATGGRLISLFAGSLAIERAVGACAVAADASPELLNLYMVLQANGADHAYGALVELDRGTARTPEAYRALGRDLRSRTPLERAARFLWLSAMAFNGIWRVNGEGKMNMSVDRARLARVDVLPPLTAFHEFAAQVHGIQIVFGWQRALTLSQPGDVLLVDPPYGEFDGYTAGGFGARDHRLLALALKEAVPIKHLGLIGFNAPGAASIYHWASIEEVERSGNVSCKGDERDPVAEIIITAGLQR